MEKERDRKEIPIKMLVMELTQLFRDAGYEAGSIKRKEETWNAIVRRHMSQGYETYEQSVIDDYVRTAKWRHETAGQNENYTRQMIRNARYLQEFHETGTVEFARKRYLSHDLSPYYESLLRVIEFHPSLGEKNKRNIRHSAGLFFVWLQEKGITFIDDMPKDSIRAYFNEKKFGKNSVYSYKSGLKTFFSYLYESGIIGEDFGDAFRFKLKDIETAPSGTRKKQEKNVMDAGIGRVIESVDTSAPRGKRDLSILLLAAELHLTAGEITNLRISGFNPEGRVLIVGKEERALSGRLSGVMEDYIRNGRPASDEPYIFLPLRKPLIKLSPQACAYIYNHYRKALSLPGAPFESLYSSAKF